MLLPASLVRSTCLSQHSHSLQLYTASIHRCTIDVGLSWSPKNIQLNQHGKKEIQSRFRLKTISRLTGTLKFVYLPWFELRAIANIYYHSRNHYWARCALSICGFTKQAVMKIEFRKVLQFSPTIEALLDKIAKRLARTLWFMMLSWSPRRFKISCVVPHSSAVFTKGICRRLL